MSSNDFQTSREFEIQADLEFFGPCDDLQQPCASIICEDCGTHNRPSVRYCSTCHADLIEQANAYRNPEKTDAKIKLDLPPDKEKTNKKYRGSFIKCVHCGALNAPQRMFCRECQLQVNGDPSPVPPPFTASASQSSPSPAGASSSTTPQKLQEQKEIKLKKKIAKTEGVVRCKHCGALNQYDLAYCYLCQMELDETEREKVKNRFKKEELVHPSEDDKIMCRICGYRNHPDNDECQDCHYPLQEDSDKPKKQAPRKKIQLKFDKVDCLICDNCGALNPPDAKFCKDCQDSLREEADRCYAARKNLIAAEPGQMGRFNYENERFHFCSNCGACVEKGIPFCPACTQPLDPM